MNNIKCPYCGKTVSYFGAFLLRRRGEYFCKRCKKESNVYIKKTIWILFLFMLALAVSALLFYLFLTDRENIWFMLIVAIPFLIFYLCSPLFIRLRPKKKFQDSLYDTEMVDTPIADPDPTMAKTAKVVPAFVDDIVLGDDEYRPAIDSSVFNAIKEERKIVADTDGGTKSFDRFENISSSADIGSTKPVESLKDIPTEPAAVAADTVSASVSETVASILAEVEEENTAKNDAAQEKPYDLSNFE